MVNARVPVLKFYGNDGEVLCDVSINNHEGQEDIRAFRCLAAAYSGGLQNSRLTLGFCRSERILGPAPRRHSWRRRFMRLTGQDWSLA